MADRLTPGEAMAAMLRTLAIALLAQARAVEKLTTHEEVRQLLFQLHEELGALNEVVQRGYASTDAKN